MSGFSPVLNPARQYAKLDFPPYVFREYPKHVTLPSGRVVEVQNQREELNALAEDSGAPPVPSDALVIELEKLRQEKLELEMKLAELEAEKQGRGKERAQTLSEAVVKMSKAETKVPPP